MHPVKNDDSTIDDLLELLLEKGVILHTDMIISVANIPLIGISLKAAIAGMETMLKYGIMETLDQKTRQWALEKIRDQEVKLVHEKIKEEMYGSYWENDGIYRAWRPGKLYLTDKRLIVYQQLPAETIFVTDIKQITGIKIVEIDNQQYTVNSSKLVLALLINDSNVEYIYSHNPECLLDSLKKIAQNLGMEIKDDFKTKEGDLNVPGS